MQRIQYRLWVYKTDGTLRFRCVFTSLSRVNMAAECFLDEPNCAVAIERQVCSRPWL